MKSTVLGNPEMVQLLLDKGAGASVNFKDSAGDTAIIYAAYGTGRGSQEFLLDIAKTFFFGINWINVKSNFFCCRSLKSLSKIG